MCLLCSGVFCCVPFKPLSVCWSSMAQMNSKEQCRADSTIEAVKPTEQPVIADVIRRSCTASQEVHGHRKVSIKSRDILDRSSERIKSLAVFTKDKSILDCSNNCCLVPALKSSRGSNNFAVYRSSDGERDISQSVTDVRRGSDPGYKIQDSNCHRSSKALRDTVLAMNPREKYKSQSQKYELNTSVVFVDERSYGLPHFDHHRNNIVTAQRTSQFDVNAYNFSTQGIRHKDFAILESNCGGATLRKPYYSSRSETAGSKDSVSEVNHYFSRHISPKMCRKKACGRTSRRWKSRDVSQTTDPMGSGDVLVMENPIFTCAGDVARKEIPGEGCDATTQTEWSNGWEPLPTGFFSLFRQRTEGMPPGLAVSCVTRDRRKSEFETFEHQIQALPNSSSSHNEGGATANPCILRHDDPGAIQSSNQSASGWGSMDNLGFLSSGESSDQTRTSNQTSTSTNYQRYRAKDDWALYKASRSEDYYNAIPRYQSDTSLDREMAQLSQEMACIQLECEVLVSRHINEKMKAGSSQGASIMPLPETSQPRFSRDFADCSRRPQPRNYSDIQRTIPTTLSLSSRLNSVGERDESFNNWMREYEIRLGQNSVKSSSGQ